MVKHVISSTRCRIAMALTTIALAISIVAIRETYVSAHAGHGNEEIGEFDIDAPRIVSPETAKHIGLKVEEVSNQPLEDILEITGIVKPDPDHNRAIVSRVAGKLLSVRGQVGSVVKKGDVIAQIDSPELARNLYEVRKLEVEYQKLLLDVERRKGDVTRLEAEIESGQAQVEVAQLDYRRAESLVNDGVAKREVESRHAEVSKREGELKVKNVEIDIARKDADGLRKQADALKLSRTAMLAIYNIDPEAKPEELIGGTADVRAESDGVITKREALPGRWLQPGDAIATIADFSVVQIEGELPETLIPRVEGRSVNKVRVRPVSAPNSMLEGSIKYIAPELEPVKRTAHLVVEVPNPKGALRGEMWVTLAIALKQNPKALAVPKSAVVIQGPMHFVFMEIESDGGSADKPAKYQKKDIDPGISDDQYVEIKDGLFPGDRVVTQGAYSLTQLRPKPKKIVAPAAGSPPAAEAHGH